MERNERTHRLGGLGHTVARHQLFAFFLITIALSWTFWIGVVTSGLGESLGLVAVIPGAFGPPVAALVVVWVNGDSVWHWIRAAIGIRVSSRWYVTALVLPVAMVSIGTVALFTLGYELLVTELPYRLSIFLPTVLFMSLLGGGQEELGWRGFALPRLERRLSPLIAAIVLGVGWAIWHLPLFYLPGASQFGTSFVMYGLGVVGLSIVFTWLFNRSVSVAVVMLLHGSYNASLILYPLSIEQLTGGASADVLAVGAGSVWLIGLLLIAFTRGGLGYVPFTVRLL